MTCASSHKGKRSNLDSACSFKQQEMEQPSRKRQTAFEEPLHACNSTATTTRSTRTRESEETQLCDLPHEILGVVLSYLDVKSLLNTRLVSQTMLKLASGASAGWKKHCHRLWATKVHVCPIARAHPHPMSAYRLAMEDARLRNHIHMKELLYDPVAHSGTVWSFRFKKAAGPEWQEVDPWFHYQPCRKMVFLANGWVKAFKPSTSTTDDSWLLENPHFSFRNGGGDILDTPNTMTWRFVTAPIDLPPREQTGSYIRVSVDGRDVPTYCVRRSPTNNWGFVMESCWGVMASFELPPRPKRRTRKGPDTVQPLVDEESFEISSSLQWREAFLYNIGVDVFPNGSDRSATFQDEYELENLLHDRGG